MDNGFSDAQLRQITKRFDDLGKGIRNRFTRRGLRRGAAVVRGAVRRRASAIDDPATAESIAKNVTVQSSRRLSRRDQIGMRVGIRGGAKKRDNVTSPGGDTWYWRFLEFGRGPVRPLKAGRLLSNKESGEFFGSSVGPAKPKPFMRPAMAESAEPAIDAVASSINADIDKFAREAK